VAAEKLGLLASFQADPHVPASTLAPTDRAAAGSD
jgi:hypothetical protein